MQNNRIAPHETFELHELLTFKNVCATKAVTMASLVNDAELKSLLQSDFSTAQGHIRELQGLIQQSDLSSALGANVAASSTTAASGTANVQ